VIPPRRRSARLHQGHSDRLLGYERFLERNPNGGGAVALVQITVPPEFHCRTPRDETHDRGDRGPIVGRYSFEDARRSPTVYTAFDLQQLAAYYIAPTSRSSRRCATA